MPFPQLPFSLHRMPSQDVHKHSITSSLPNTYLETPCPQFTGWQFTVGSGIEPTLDNSKVNVLPLHHPATPLQLDNTVSYTTLIDE